MKAIAAALVLLAVLAMAEARPTMRVLNKKTTKASASSSAIALDGGSAESGATADATDGGQATSKSGALAIGDGADAESWAKSKANDGGKADATSDATAVGKDANAASDATATADDWGQATATSDALALGKDSDAKSTATADADGEVTATAKSDALAIGNADATSTATATGDATATAKAVAVAKEDPKDPEHLYYPYKYYKYYPTVDEESSDEEDPYHYYYAGYYGYKAVDPTVKYPYHGHYVVVEESEESEEEYTPVKWVDPAIIAYYSKHVYDYGCFEGKYYRCTYDDSCGKCPYGYFCGEKTEKVCEDVEVWVKKCDAAPAKKCVPDLSACGTGFCKYNEKCAADYYWCGASWCTPKYACVAVEAPKKCVWELKDGKKVQTCTEYAAEACGKETCPIGYKCSEDPCTFVKETVKKCEDKAVPVCVAYDIPTYKTLYSKCGPAYCHPGYKCESFDHDTCVVKVVHHPVYVGYKPHDPVTVDEESSDEDDHVYVPYVPHYPADPKDKDSSASVTATAKSVATPDGVATYGSVDASATGDGVASGNADATASNGDSSALSWAGGSTSKDGTDAAVKTTADGDNAVATGDANAEFNSDK